MLTKPGWCGIVMRCVNTVMMGDIGTILATVVACTGMYFQVTQVEKVWNFNPS